MKPIFKKNINKTKLIIILSIILTLCIKPVLAFNELNFLKETIQNNYLYSIPRDTLNTNNPNDLFKNLDEHSQYYDREAFQSFKENLSTVIGGIGVYIQKRSTDEIYITEVFEGSPACRAGLRNFDEIISVDDEEVADLSLDEVSNLIRGQVGSKVNLKVRSQGSSHVKDVEITRNIVNRNPVISKILEDNIGYIAIKSFSNNVSKDVITVLQEFEKENIEKLILDVRGNPGGYLEEALEISRLLVPKAPIVHIKDKDSTITHSSFLDKAPFKKENLVILIDENSASASEILAAAIQGTKTGFVIGQNSFGKGTVQKLYELPTGAGFTLTEATYLSPNKNNIESKGVSPDIQINRFYADMESLITLDQPTIIKIGEKSEIVQGVQQRLKLMNYNISDKKGYFGESTKSAIAKYKENVLMTEELSSLFVEKNKVMYVPMRTIFERFNYEISWDSKTNTAIATNKEKHIEIPLDSNNIGLNNDKYILSTPVQSFNGSLHIPVEALDKTIFSGEELNESFINRLNDDFFIWLNDEKQDMQMKAAIDFLKGRSYKNE